MKRKLTLKEISKEFNVSISTVSKALKDSSEIGEDTRLKIQAFAKFYNYKPNNIALRLKNKKSKTIGVIIPEIVHHFFSMVINGIDRVAMHRGYNVIVSVSNESFEKEVINMETLANSPIDGFILSISKETLFKKDFHHINETILQGMPVVLFDRVVEEILCDKVVVDDKQGARLATDFLIQKGCKQILLITTQDHISVGYLRTQGYIETLNANNYPIDEDLIIKTVDEKGSEEELIRLENQVIEKLKTHPNIDAIFAVNEIYGAVGLKAVKQLNKNVPDDVSIICFTDGVISKYSSPTLSTISQHADEIGEMAADMLINKLESSSPSASFDTKILECSLIERASTK